MLFSKLTGATDRWRARRRKVAHLAGVVQRLPADQRAVYLMCTAGRRSQPAVAAELGISVAEVQERLAAALVELAAIMDEDDGAAVAPDRPPR